MDLTSKQALSTPPDKLITAKDYQLFLQKTDNLTEEEYRTVFGDILTETCTPPYWYSDIESAYRRFAKLMREKKEGGRVEHRESD